MVMTIIMIKTFVGLDAGRLPWVQGHLFPKALRGAVFLCAGKWTIAKLGRNQQIPKNVLYLGKANLPSLHHPVSSSQSPSTESLSSTPITATKMHSSKNLHISQSEAVLKISIMILLHQDHPRGHFIHLFLTEEVEEKTDPTSCKGRDILAPPDGEWRLQLAWPLPSLEFPRLKCKPPLKTGDRLPLKQPCLPCSLSPFFNLSCSNLKDWRDCHKKIY